MKRLLLIWSCILIVVLGVKSDELNDLNYQIPDLAIEMFDIVTSNKVAEYLYEDFGYKYDLENQTSKFRLPEDVYTDCTIFWPTSSSRYRSKVILMETMHFGALSKDDFMKYVVAAYHNKGWNVVSDDDGFLGQKEVGSNTYNMVISFQESPITTDIYFIRAFFMEATKPQTQASTIKSNNYVDLGLPSGTLWKESNEEGFFSFKDAVAKFGKSLPTKAQVLELKKKCQWTPVENGYIVKGPNSNTIYIPAAGCIDNEGLISRVGFDGGLWTYEKCDVSSANMLYIVPSLNKINIGCYPNLYTYSVRLVK